MIIYQKKLVTFLEAWFGEEPTSSGVDIVRCFQQSSRMSDALCREFHTIIVDLTREPDDLLASMKKDSRYEIRRALKKENLVYEFWNARQSTVLAEFGDVYGEFASLKNLPKLDHTWLSLMADTGGLNITQVRAAAGAPPGWHVYYRSGGRATLLYSVPPPSVNGGVDRSRLGRANRFHHWQDMLRLKSEGETTYDFGGWYAGTRNSNRLKINRFKEEFGGRVVKDYICERAITLKGKLFLQARRLLLGDAI